MPKPFIIEFDRDLLFSPPMEYQIHEKVEELYTGLMCEVMRKYGAIGLIYGTIEHRTETRDDKVLFRLVYKPVNPLALTGKQCPHCDSEVESTDLWQQTVKFKCGLEVHAPVNGCRVVLSECEKAPPFQFHADAVRKGRVGEL